MEGASGFHLETFGMKFEIFQIVQRSVTVTEIISSPTSFFKIPEKTNLAIENCAKAVNIQLQKGHANAETQQGKTKTKQTLTSFIAKEIYKPLFLIY